MLKLLSFSNFIIPWRPWRGVALGDLLENEPDAIFAVAALASRHRCHPMLLRAILTAKTIRKLQLAGHSRRRRGRRVPVGI